MSKVDHKPDMQLFLSDARGIYIPRDFAGTIGHKYVTGVSEDDWQILEAGPEHDEYWDAWQDVLDNAVITDDKGTVYSLYQDGDLWLIPAGMEWDEYSETYIWPKEELDDDRDYNARYEP